MIKTLIKYGALPAVLGILLIISNIKVSHLRSENNTLRLSKDSVVQINDSTSAILAGTENQLADAKTVARDLQAKLIAATSITVTPEPVSSTILVPVKVGTDSTRYAEINDTTSVGTLHANIEIPPLGDIKFDYRFSPAPLNLKVFLLRNDENKAIFAVTYSGGSTEIEAPYANIPKREKILFGYGEGAYNFGNYIVLRAGGSLRLWKTYVFTQVQQAMQAGQNPQLEVGIRYRF